MFVVSRLCFSTQLMLKLTLTNETGRPRTAIIETTSSNISVCSNKGNENPKFLRPSILAKLMLNWRVQSFATNKIGNGHSHTLGMPTYIQGSISMPGRHLEFKTSAWIFTNSQNWKSIAEPRVWGKLGNLRDMGIHVRVRQYGLGDSVWIVSDRWPVINGQRY